MMILIRAAASIAMGLAAGISAVYVFNRIPAKWLCDYDEKPSTEMWGERIKKRPWAVVFALVFTACALKLMEQGLLFALPGVLAIWLLLLIGIADRKYMIIPDELVIALSAVALGFIPYHPFMLMLLGAAIGGGSILLMGIAGRLIFRKDAMGFGDVKLFTAIGLITGMKGVVIVLLITIFSSAVVFAFGLMTGKVKSGDQQPLGPFIAAAASAYLLFQTELIFLADLYI